MYVKLSNINDILAIAQSFSQGLGDISTMFFMDTNVLGIEELHREHTGTGIRFIGGVTPGLIVGASFRDCGALIRRYASTTDPFVVSDFVMKNLFSLSLSFQDMEIPFTGGGDTGVPECLNFIYVAKG